MNITPTLFYKTVKYLQHDSQFKVLLYNHTKTVARLCDYAKQTEFGIYADRVGPLLPYYMQLLLLLIFSFFASTDTTANLGTLATARLP